MKSHSSSKLTFLILISLFGVLLFLACKKEKSTPSDPLTEGIIDSLLYIQSEKSVDFAFFLNNLERYVYLDPLSGASTGAPFPPYTPIATSTTMAPVSQNMDASNNIFGVSGGDKLPTAMSMDELFEVENKIVHAIDYASLGFVTVKPTHAFVTTASFISPYTTSKLMGRAVAVASDGWTINAQSSTYAETVTVDKNLTFANDGTTILNNLTINGAGKSMTLANDYEVAPTGTLTLTDGWVQTGANFLRVTNTAAAAISGGGGSSHVVGKLNRSVNTGSLYVFPVGNGTDLEELSMEFTTVSSLTDITVEYTTTAPGTSLTTFN